MKNTVRQRLLGSTMICGLTVVLAAPAFAQEPAPSQARPPMTMPAQPESPAAPTNEDRTPDATQPMTETDAERADAQADAEEEGTVSAVTVTGSRIIRQDFESISPVTTVGSEQIDLTGTLTVDTLLNELPNVIPGNTRTSNNAGGESFATVDLRGLGTNRTLVLVNGERIPGSSTTGTVDINTIPATLIDRVEVVTGGGSAVYGSDAVAGVVNFILKDDYEGVELTGTYGASFEGKAAEVELNALVGGNFANDKGNLTAYASYYNRDRVSQSEFEYSRTSGAICSNQADFENPFVCDTTAEALAAIAAGGGVLQPGGSGAPAWGTIPSGQGFQNLATLLPAQFGAGTYDTNCDGVPNTTAFNSGTLTFDPQGRLSPSQTAGACAVPTTLTDRSGIRGGSTRYNFAPDNLLVIPAERFNIFTSGTYKFRDNVRGKIQLNFVNSTSEVQLAPTPAQAGTAITITPNAPMLAFIDKVAPDLGVAIRGRTNPSAPFTMARRFNEVGTRNSFDENNSFFLLSTLEGEINDTTSWSITASYGSNRFDSRGTNSVNSTALNQGLAACATPAGAPLGIQALPGCVPLDVFGAGTLTQPMIDFIRVDTFSTTQVDESRIAGFVRGNLFTLPAGPIAYVLGAEYRDTNAEFRVDNEQRTGNIKGFNAVQDQSGAIDVYEAYGELAVPVLKDLPFADYLGLEAGYRISDYSSIGQVSTYKIGGEYAPFSFLRFRAIYNEATRAPSVFELFQNGDQGFPAYVDPCANRNASAQLLAFCSSTAGGFNFAGFVQPNQQTQAFAFGNPNLQAEDAKTTTVGLVLQPKFDQVGLGFIPGTFRATVDYYDIAIDNLVRSFGAQFFLNQCYTNLNLADPACARINRNAATGEVFSVNTTVGNQGTFETSGVDMQVEYGANFSDIPFLRFIPGRFRINELLTYVNRYKFNGTEFRGTTSAGIGGATFDYKSVLSVTYQYEDLTLFGRWSYVPELDDEPGFGFVTIPKDPAASFVDVSARYNLTDHLTLTANIDNIFGEEPPQTIGGTFAQANTDVQIYRPLGRTFTISARARF